MPRLDQSPAPEHLLNAEQVAEILGITLHALAQLRYRDQGPTYVKLGRAVRYRPSDVAAFIEASVVETRTSRGRGR